MEKVNAKEKEETLAVRDIIGDRNPDHITKTKKKDKHKLTKNNPLVQALREIEEWNTD